MHRVRLVLVLALLAIAAGCSTPPPLPTVSRVELPRFMGDWFVIAHIPASSEREAHNAVESYRLEPDGTIATTYAFRDGSFEGELEVMEPSAVVWDTTTNATWGMRFVWPFRFQYLITYLADDYTSTIVSRSARDYAWIMTRSPDVTDAEYATLVAELGRQGYDVSRLRRVPHWRAV